MFTGVTSLERGAFNGCTHLNNIYLRNITNINTYFSGTNTPFDNIGLQKIILPSLKTSGDYCFRGTKNTTIIDIGPNYTSLFSKMAGGVTANTQTFVLRPDRVVNVNPETYNFNPKRIYVPSNQLEAYRTDSNWSTYYANKLYAIGGTEWTTQFGSSDEYADLTQQEYLDNYA